VATDIPTPMWLGRYPMVEAEHEPELEQRAAIHEFQNKLPRHLAEAAAHRDYRHDQMVEATAHHLVGMRAAHAAGATDQAQKHAALYVMGLRAMGHDNTIAPPDDVAAKALHTPAEVYRFKAHKGDVFALRTHEGEDKPEELQKSAPLSTGVYSWHLGGTDVGASNAPGALSVPRNEDKANTLAETAFVGALPVETKFSPTQRGQGKNVFTEGVPPQDHGALNTHVSQTPEAGALAGALAIGHAVQWLKRVRAKLQKADDVVGKPIAALSDAPAVRSIESRRYGQNGRTAAGKKNPYFNYDDYIPQEMKVQSTSTGARPSGITVYQKGKTVTAALNHGFGEVQAYRRGDGGYAITYDSLKKGHPVVQPYREHVVRALADHLKAAHGAPYFLTGDEPSRQGPVN
jgi:hypothetical protein